MRRRDFIALLGGAAAAWPLAARAQQAERARLLAVIMVGSENDPERTHWLTVFVQGLRELGWTEGRNLRLEVRWAGDTAERMRMIAQELVDLHPDAILASGTPAVAALQRETRTIPIVFVLVADPVGDSFVATLSSPGGNITGFGSEEADMGGKWLELLTQLAPGMKRAAIMFNPDTAPYVKTYYLPQFDRAARALGVTSIIAPVHSPADIETLISSLGREPGGGLVLPGDAFQTGNRPLIIALAARNNVPAVSNSIEYVRIGGLMSYGADLVDMYRRAAPYVDRILRGEKPADLPVQLPIKFDLGINRKTAKALGLAVPQPLLVAADEVIE